MRHERKPERTPISTIFFCRMWADVGRQAQKAATAQLSIATRFCRKFDSAPC